MTWSVSRDSGCVRSLLWRLDLPDDVAIDGLVAALVRQGFVDRGTPGIVHDLHAPDETSVVVVPRTRRVQLRLCYLVAAADRETHARSLAVSIRGWTFAEDHPT